MGKEGLSLALVSNSLCHTWDSETKEEILSKTRVSYIEIKIRQKFNTYSEQALTSPARITPVALHKEKHNAKFCKQSAIQMQ